jgi:S-DNA-T family DNA segregation ATPase FtsK/SpoIIIE
VTSTLLTLADHSLNDPDHAEVYVVDARGDARWDLIERHPQCVAVVRLHESERLQRLLHRLVARTQHHRGSNDAPVLLIIDGLEALRRSLDDLDTAGEYDALEQILADAASAGVTIVAGVEQAAALPTSFVARCPVRWVLHVHDAHDAALLGVAPTQVPPAIPGRLVIAGSGLTAQLVTAELRAPRDSPTSSNATARPIVVVPAHVDISQLPSSHTADHVTLLCLGLEFTTAEPFVMEVPDGEHVLLVGNSRSGRSSGLARISAAWSAAHPQAWIGAILPRRSTFPPHLAARTASDATTIAALLDELTAHLKRHCGPNDPPALLVVDDAEMADDPGGRIMSLATLGTGLCIAAAGRPDVLRQSYAHWTGVLRRSRLGLVATGGNELDGDLLGAQLPRRTPVAARAGLWWVIDNRSARLAQLALDGTIGFWDRSLATKL